MHLVRARGYEPPLNIKIHGATKLEDDKIKNKG